MGKRVVWLLAACTGLVLFLRGDGLAYICLLYTSDAADE